jgi:hypothetical protein
VAGAYASEIVFCVKINIVQCLSNIKFINIGKLELNTEIHNHKYMPKLGSPYSDLQN